MVEVKEAKESKKVKELKETKSVKEVVVAEAEAVVEEVESPWYYFFSQGCGWCKKATPEVEALIDAGHDILMLDLAEPDNQKLSQELKTEFNTQCGTPWFVNADTGKGICGFREKDILEKWLNGEDIPVPPRPSGPPPKIPFQGSTGKEEMAWKREYKNWLHDNKHMPEDWLKRQKSANEIIDSPRPNSDPPRPPMTPDTTDEQLDAWGTEMKAWQDENKHIPNLQPVDRVVENLKNRRKQALNASQTNQAMAPSGAPNAAGSSIQLNTLDAKVQALEVKIDRIISHFGVK